MLHVPHAGTCGVQPHPQAGVIQLVSAHGVAHGVAQGAAHPQAGAGLQPQVVLFWPQIGHGAVAGVSGQAPPVITGISLHGQAAIALFSEHVAIPTAIAAATVSFLIVIFTSLCY